MTKRMQKILLGFSLLLAVPFVVGYGLYYGYCHSWWGKDNLLFRSLWLCSCPAGFEETLYPDYVEVLFSACDWQVEVDYVLNSGEYILIKNDPATPEMPQYLWDTRSDEKIPFTYEAFQFLNDVWIKDYSIKTEEADGVITNWKTGEYILNDFLNEGEYPSPYLSNGMINPEAKQFFFPDNQRVVFFDTTGSDFITIVPLNWDEPNKSIEVSQGDNDWLKQFLLDAEIPFIMAPDVVSVSPNENYEALQSGVMNITKNIYLLEFNPNTFQTDHRQYCFINCPLSPSPCCWVADNQSVIYQFQIGGLVWMPYLSTGIPWSAPSSVEDRYPGPVIQVYLSQN